MLKIGMVNAQNISGLRRMDVQDICDLRFSEKELTEKFEVFYKKWWGDTSADPRTAVSEKISIVRHHQWFSSKENLHFNISVPERQLTNLLRFRMGNTDLRIYDHDLPRERRTCMLCGQKKMEDELHVVFECHYYGNLREYPRWKKLYENGDISMINFMNQKDQYTLAHYITVLLRCRKEGLRHHRGIDFFSSSGPSHSSANDGDTHESDMVEEDAFI